jgi:hypothetical protein
MQIPDRSGDLFTNVITPNITKKIQNHMITVNELDSDPIVKSYLMKLIKLIEEKIE